MLALTRLLLSESPALQPIVASGRSGSLAWQWQGLREEGKGVRAGVKPSHLQVTDHAHG